MLHQARIPTERLVLEPLADEVARAVLAGDYSGIERAVGWPHADTADALRSAIRPDEPSRVWLVQLAGVLIGDCGTAGGVDDTGTVEIGYGLAAEHRGHGYGNEIVAALSRWLLVQAPVICVVAETFTVNVASRRALEKAGFSLSREDAEAARYTLFRAAAKPDDDRAK